ncbi:hypothetical protein B9Z45_16250, partial [Limnohabitans sp. 2KL-17]|uniref:beta strand repeat-containing protein n=1 Tax=Limnohabitans sp. 2KL-17 TaxID=1100704 RepID=UPI000DD1A6C5
APKSAALVSGGVDAGHVQVWASQQQGSERWYVFGQRYDANGLPVGSEFRVHVATTGNHGFLMQSAGIQELDVTGLTGGGFVVTWGSDNNSDWQIYSRRFDANGTALDAADVTVNTYSSDYQMAPQISKLSDGGYVIVWASNGQDGSGSGVYGQRYNSGGVAQGGEFLVNVGATAGNQGSRFGLTDYYEEALSVVGLKNGGFVVTWFSDASGTGEVFARRYDLNGTPQGSIFQVNTATVGKQWFPQITDLADGGFLVTYADDTTDGAGYGVYAQRYDSNGDKMGVNFRINTTTSGNQGGKDANQDDRLHDVAGLANGGWVAVWCSDNQDGSLSGIYSQVYDREGQPVGPETRVNTVTANEQRHTTVSALADGGYVVGWGSFGPDGSNWGVYQKFFDANGTELAAPKTFTELAGADTPANDVVINDTVTVTDVDGLSEIVTASVVITNFKTGDELLFTNTTLITGTYSAGTLTLSKVGGQTVTDADFQAALRTVKFNNTSDTPDTTARSITFKASDASAISTTFVTQTVNVVATNDAPTAVALTNTTTSLAETTSTTTRIRVADIAVTDDAQGTNTITLTGTDAGNFEVVGAALYLKAGVVLNYETKASYAVSVKVADSTVAGSTFVSTNYALQVIDTTAPNAPTLTSLTDNVGAVQGAVSNNGNTDDTTPTLRYSLSGTNALAGHQIQLFDGTKSLGSAVTLTVSDITNGFVDLTPSTLSTGTYNFNAKLTDKAGNTSNASSSNTVNITATPTLDLNGASTTGTGSSVSKSVGSLPQTTIAFHFFRLDTWDNELFNVYVNDQVVFSQAFLYSTNTEDNSGTHPSGYSWTLARQNYANFYGNTLGADGHYYITITSPFVLDNFKLGFGSTLDQAGSDESFGVDNVTINGTIIDTFPNTTPGYGSYGFVVTINPSWTILAADGLTTKLSGQNFWKYQEGGETGLQLAANAALTSTSNIKRIEVTPQGLLNGSAENLLIGTTKLNADGTSLPATVVDAQGLTWTVTYASGRFSFTPSPVTFVTTSQAQAFIQGLSYINGEATPDAGLRTFTVSVVDVNDASSTAVANFQVNKQNVPITVTVDGVQSGTIAYGAGAASSFASAPQISGSSTMLDTLKITAAKAELSDLLDPAQGVKLTSIERIDLATSTAANTLTLSNTEVLAMGSEDAVLSTTSLWKSASYALQTGASNAYKQVVVDGGTNDTLVLGGNWRNDGAVTKDGKAYAVYSSAPAYSLAAPVNLLSNGSFSNSTFVSGTNSSAANWTLSPTNAPVFPPGRGTDGDIAANFNYGKPSGGFMYQTIDTVAGKTYTMQVDAYGADGAFTETQVELAAFNDTNFGVTALSTQTFTGLAIEGSTSSNTNRGTVYAITFTASSTRTSVRIKDATATASDSQDLIVDRVVVFESATGYIAGSNGVNDTSLNDTIKGTSSDDRLMGGTGNDTMDGGEGTDYALYSGNRSEYTISAATGNTTGTTTVTDNRVGGRLDGTDGLTNIEYLQFNDGVYTVATGAFVAAAQVLVNSDIKVSANSVNAAQLPTITNLLTNGSLAPVPMTKWRAVPATTPSMGRAGPTQRCTQAAVASTPSPSRLAPPP